MQIWKEFHTRLPIDSETVRLRFVYSVFPSEYNSRASAVRSNQTAGWTAEESLSVAEEFHEGFLFSQAPRRVKS